MSRKKNKMERLNQSRLLARVKAQSGMDTTDPDIRPPSGAVLANKDELSHNNTYGGLPRFYIDKVVVCRNCGTEEIWAAGRQKWWYEVAKGNINTRAVLCRSCREAKRQK